MGYQNQIFPQLFFSARAGGRLIGRAAGLGEKHSCVICTARLFRFFIFSSEAILQKSRSCADGTDRVLGISLTSQASKMTVFRFQENGHFLHMAHKCPACRLRQSGIVRTNALLAGIWNSCGLSGCPDRCPACRDLSRTRNPAAVYTDALLAGNGKQRLDIRMHCLPGMASLIQPCKTDSSARLTTAQPGRTFRMILPGLLFCRTA